MPLPRSYVWARARGGWCVRRAGLAAGGRCCVDAMRLPMILCWVTDAVRLGGTGLLRGDYGTACVFVPVLTPDRDVVQVL